MIGLETSRLICREWTKADFSLFEKFYADIDNARFVGGVKSPEESWRLMATYVGHHQLLGYSYVAIDEKETGECIGTVGLWNSAPWPEPELGYWLLPSAQGKGFGLEAGIAIRDYARHELQLKSLVSYIHPENHASKKLALRLGATLDGAIDLLDFGRHEVYRYW